MLTIPPETALLDLTVDGTRVAQPERPDGRVALGEQHRATEPRVLEDSRNHQGRTIIRRLTCKFPLAYY
jgi:hypothetical protein